MLSNFSLGGTRVLMKYAMPCMLERFISRVFIHFISKESTALLTPPLYLSLSLFPSLPFSSLQLLYDYNTSKLHLIFRPKGKLKRK